jgi:hypothetical protein
MDIAIPAVHQAAQLQAAINILEFVQAAQPS